MFRWLKASLSAVVLVAFAPAVRAADDDPKEIVAKAIKAHGGEEFLTKMKAAQTKAKGKMNVPGAGELDFTQELSYMLPDKFKDSVELKVMGQTLNVLTLVNGDKITLELNGKDIDGADKVKDAMKGVGHVMQVARMVPLLKDKSYELSLIGEDKVEGKKVIGVRVVKKDQKDVSIYFDKETGLLAKLEYRNVAPGTEMEVTEERIISEYQKNKDGIPIAKKILIKHDGKTFLDAEVTETKFFEKLDEAEFKK
jgi:hypothetical protein